MICAPAIVLDNQDYDIFIDTSFLENNHVKIIFNSKTLTILKQVLPIFTTRSLKKLDQYMFSLTTSLTTCLISLISNILTLCQTSLEMTEAYHSDLGQNL